MAQHTLNERTLILGVQTEEGKVDNLGRMLIPAAMRHRLGINADRQSGGDTNNKVEIQCDGSQIIIKPLRSLCIICGDPADDTVMDKGICDRCAKLVRGL